MDELLEKAVDIMERQAKVMVSMHARIQELEALNAQLTNALNDASARLAGLTMAYRMDAMGLDIESDED